MTTEDVTRLIDALKNLTQRNSITPQVIANILQQIVNLLQGNSGDIKSLSDWFDTMSRKSVLNSISQVEADPADLRLIIDRMSLKNGSVDQENEIVFRQATTEHAGAMGAQQVIDLDAAKRELSDLRAQVEDIDAIIAELRNSSGVTAPTVPAVHTVDSIDCYIENNELKVSGISRLVESGCVPYIFRLTKKRNQYRHKIRDDSNIDRKYCMERKGWNLWGSKNSVKVENGTVYFSTNDRTKLTETAEGFSSEPSALVVIHTKDLGEQSIGWGRSVISLHDNNSLGRLRMIRLRFAIGFAKPIGPGRVRVTPAHMMSTLAEFSVVYDTGTRALRFSR